MLRKLRKRGIWVLRAFIDFFAIYAITVKLNACKIAICPEYQFLTES